jgi:hypothetical protein
MAEHACSLPRRRRPRRRRGPAAVMGPTLRWSLATAPGSILAGPCGPRRHPKRMIAPDPSGSDPQRVHGPRRACAPAHSRRTTVRNSSHRA